MSQAIIEPKGKKNINYLDWKLKIYFRDKDTRSSIFSRIYFLESAPLVVT